MPSTTGTLRAKGVYDTVSGAKGQLAEATRYVGADAYTNKIVAYYRLYRVLRSNVTIPASEGALAGTYERGLSANSARFSTLVPPRSTEFSGSCGPPWTA
ncbi:hypothetical protein ABZ027_22955 [Streptomyces sp. NPDC006332]|uniref:hypothetical protein n=1 Tax=Streptomyces sp. NPDC006332 TaxID=3155456 RepID=UPI0033BDECF3